MNKMLNDGKDIKSFIDKLTDEEPETDLTLDDTLEMLEKINKYINNAAHDQDI